MPIRDKHPGSATPLVTNPDPYVMKGRISETLWYGSCLPAWACWWRPLSWPRWGSPPPPRGRPPPSRPAPCSAPPPASLHHTDTVSVVSVADPDLVPFWPLDPGSVIVFFRIPDLGSQTHIVESLVTIFWVKSSIILWKLAQIFFFSTSSGSGINIPDPQHSVLRNRNRNLPKVGTGNGIVKNSYGSATLDTVVKDVSVLGNSVPDPDPWGFEIRIRIRCSLQLFRIRGIRLFMSLPYPVRNYLYGSGAGSVIRLRNRILLFSSVAFKMPTKKFFSPKFVLLITVPGYLL